MKEFDKILAKLVESAMPLEAGIVDDIPIRTELPKVAESVDIVSIPQGRDYRKPGPKPRPYPELVIEKLSEVGAQTPKERGVKEEPRKVKHWYRRF